MEGKSLKLNSPRRIPGKSSPALRTINAAAFLTLLSPGTSNAGQPNAPLSSAEGFSSMATSNIKRKKSSLSLKRVAEECNVSVTATDHSEFPELHLNSGDFENDAALAIIEQDIAKALSFSKESANDSAESAKMAASSHARDASDAAILTESPGNTQSQRKEECSVVGERSQANSSSSGSSSSSASTCSKGSKCSRKILSSDYDSGDEFVSQPSTSLPRKRNLSTASIISGCSVSSAAKKARGCGVAEDTPLATSTPLASKLQPISGDISMTGLRASQLTPTVSTSSCKKSAPKKTVGATKGKRSCAARKPGKSVSIVSTACNTSIDMGSMGASKAAAVCDAQIQIPSQSPEADPEFEAFSQSGDRHLFKQFCERYGQIKDENAKYKSTAAKLRRHVPVAQRDLEVAQNNVKDLDAQIEALMAQRESQIKRVADITKYLENAVPQLVEVESKANKTSSQLRLLNSKLAGSSNSPT